MRRAAVVLVAVSVAALVAAGCGGSDEPTNAEYGEQLRDAMADVEAAYGATADTPSGEGGDAVEQLRTTQVGLRDAGNRLADVTPPADLQDEHDALVAGVRDMADAVDKLVEAQDLAERDPARARALAREFASDDSFASVEAAASAIQDAGVDAGL
jgi:hypothetical protein